MDYFAGIDVGASTTKAIIINQKREVLGHSVVFSGADFQAAAVTAFDKASKMAGGRTSKERTVISTG